MWFLDFLKLSSTPYNDISLINLWLDFLAGRGDDRRVPKFYDFEKEN